MSYNISSVVNIDLVFSSIYRHCKKTLTNEIKTECY